MFAGSRTSKNCTQPVRRERRDALGHHRVEVAGDREHLAVGRDLLVLPGDVGVHLAEGLRRRRVGDVVDRDVLARGDEQPVADDLGAGGQADVLLDRAEVLDVRRHHRVGKRRRRGLRRGGRGSHEQSCGRKRRTRESQSITNRHEPQHPRHQRNKASRGLRRYPKCPGIPLTPWAECGPSVVSDATTKGESNDRIHRPSPPRTPPRRRSSGTSLCALPIWIARRASTATSSASSSPPGDPTTACRSRSSPAEHTHWASS